MGINGWAKHATINIRNCEYVGLQGVCRSCRGLLVQDRCATTGKYATPKNGTLSEPKHNHQNKNVSKIQGIYVEVFVIGDKLSGSSKKISFWSVAWGMAQFPVEKLFCPDCQDRNLEPRISRGAKYKNPTNFFRCGEVQEKIIRGMVWTTLRCVLYI